MAEEANVKLRLKVETREITKLKTELSQFKKEIESGNVTPKVAGTGEATKKAKKETEELSNTQKFAAEISKTLGEEQNQLATNVDAAEVAQKALGAALQSYVGISPVAIGATLAIGAAAYQLTQQYKNLDASLVANGATWGDYISNLIQGRDLTNTFGIRQTALAGGIRLSGQELGEFSGTIERLKRVLGDNAKDIVDKAIGGDEGAARQLGVVFRSYMTALQRRQVVINRMRELNSQEVAAIREGARARAEAFNADSISSPDVGMGGGEAINAEAAGNAAADRMRAINEAANRSLTESTQIAWAGRQDIVDRGVMAYQNSMRAVEVADQTRLENYLKGNGSLEISEQELTNRRIGWLQTLNSIRITSDMTQEQQDAARQARQQAANQALAAETELRNRNNTAQGIKNRLYQEALGRAIASGANINRLERLSISNSQIRVQLEAKLAELKAKVATQTGAAAEGTRREIAGILNEIRGLSSGAVVSIKEIKSAFEDLRNSLAANGAALSAQSIFRGALSPANMALELGRIRQLRDESNRVLQEKLDAQAQILARYDAARTNAERARLNTQLQRSQQEVGIARGHVQAYDQAFQTVSQAATNFNSETNRGLLGAQTQLDNDLYQDRLRRIAGSQRDSANTMQGFRDRYQAWLATLTGDANQFQLEMARGFNPASMIEAINQGVNYARETVTVEEQRLAQLESSGASREAIIAQEERVTSAKQNLAAATRDAASAQRELSQAQQDASFGGQFLKSITANTKGLQGLGSYAGGMVTTGLNMLSDAAWAAFDAMKSGENVGDAIVAVLSETLKSIGQEAGIKALMETAAGIAATVTPGMQATAPGHFAAAGVYAAVAVAAGAGYMALPTPPDKKKKEDNDVERDLLNMKSRIPNVNINGAVFATKEEVGKAITEAYSTYNSKW
jgi:hypothetical protein